MIRSLCGQGFAHAKSQAGPKLRSVGKDEVVHGTHRIATAQRGKYAQKQNVTPLVALTCPSKRIGNPLQKIKYPVSWHMAITLISYCHNNQNIALE
jgi:hypothetical protein